MICYATDNETFTHDDPERAAYNALLDRLEGLDPSGRTDGPVEVFRARMREPKLSELIKPDWVSDHVESELEDLVPDPTEVNVDAATIEESWKELAPELDKLFEKRYGQLPLIVDEKLPSVFYLLSVEGEDFIWTETDATGNPVLNPVFSSCTSEKTREWPQQSQFLKRQQQL